MLGTTICRNPNGKYMLLYFRETISDNTNIEFQPMHVFHDGIYRPKQKFEKETLIAERSID